MSRPICAAALALAFTRPARRLRRAGPHERAGRHGPDRGARGDRAPAAGRHGRPRRLGHRHPRRTGHARTALDTGTTCARCWPSPSRSRASAPTRRCPAWQRSPARRSTAAPRRPACPSSRVRAALALRSPDGRSYAERIDAVKTERQLSEIFEDFIGMVPLGKTFFASRNPVRTGGPMQVSIAFAEAHAQARPYPYAVRESIRREVFTRRGGLYFGTAHLLDYDAPYDSRSYRFADFNAGRYASRNAAFQNALSVASGLPVTLDGDLLPHGSDAPRGETERAAAHARRPARPERAGDPPRPREGRRRRLREDRALRARVRLCRAVGQAHAAACRAAAHRPAEPEDHAQADHRMVRQARRRTPPPLPGSHRGAARRLTSHTLHPQVAAAPADLEV